MTALVIGLGSDHRGDDGIGLAVARWIAHLAPAGVDVVECDAPVSLIDTWAGVDRVVVVDALCSSHEPGTVLAFDVTEQPLPTTHRTAGGTHALGLSDVIELARALGSLPPRLSVVGVEVAGDALTGSALSAGVMAAIEAAGRAALSAVGRPD